MHVPPKLINLDEIASSILNEENINDAEKNEIKPESNRKDVDK